MLNFLFTFFSSEILAVLLFRENPTATLILIDALPLKNICSRRDIAAGCATRPLPGRSPYELVCERPHGIYISLDSLSLTNILCNITLRFFFFPFLFFLVPLSQLKISV